MVLLALIRLGDDAYGVPISNEIEASSGRGVSIGSIYITLDRLERKGLVSSSLGEPTAARGRPRQNVFPHHRQGPQRSSSGATHARPPMARCATARRRPDMKTSEPPRLSTSLLVRLAPRHRRESLVGDLLEQLRQGRSLWWFRRQVLATILVGLAADVAAHKLLAVRALALGWSAMLVSIAVDWTVDPRNADDTLPSLGIGAVGRFEILRQLWVYYGLPFQLVFCLILMAIGWLVAGLLPSPRPRHRDCVRGDASNTGYFPGAGDPPAARNGIVAGLGMGLVPLGATVSGHACVGGVSLCILIGGLCTARSDGDR